MDNKELIAELRDMAKAMSDEGFCIDSDKLKQAAQALAAQDARIAELEAALEPFGSGFVDCHVDDEGWTSPMKTTRIVDWFGPTDFRRAKQAMK